MGERAKRLRQWIPVIALFLCVAIMGVIDEDRGGNLAWAKSYADGLAQAGSRHRPMLISFHTPGCGWCAKLDAETFTDPTVVELSRKFVCVRVDSDVDPTAVHRYGVFEYPTILFADSGGRELGRITSFVEPSEFAESLRKLSAAWH
jgi:thiol:disulfide interchange protein DsbD